MESKICTAPRTAYWKPFKVKEVVVVEYRALVVEDGKNPQLKYKKRKGIAMCAKEKDGDVWLWYPIRNDVGIDCKLMPADEALTVKHLKDKRVRKKVLRAFVCNNSVKPLSPGMHPELVSKFKRHISPLVRRLF